eukprot:8437677-Pyramimonas_sp.AAC.1
MLHHRYSRVFPTLAGLGAGNSHWNRSARSVLDFNSLAHWSDRPHTQKKIANTPLTLTPRSPEPSGGAATARACVRRVRLGPANVCDGTRGRT